jgi:hypothetical protein
MVRTFPSDLEFWEGQCVYVMEQVIEPELYEMSR